MIFFLYSNFVSKIGYQLWAHAWVVRQEAWYGVLRQSYYPSAPDALNISYVVCWPFWRLYLMMIAECKFTIQRTIDVQLHPVITNRVVVGQFGSLHTLLGFFHCIELWNVSWNGNVAKKIHSLTGTFAIKGVCITEYTFMRTEVGRSLELCLLMHNDRIAGWLHASWFASQEDIVSFCHRVRALKAAAFL